MKKMMMSMLGLTAGSLFAAEVAYNAQITDSRWSKSADGNAYTVKYDGKDYPMLDVQFETKPDTIYKATFQIDASREPSECAIRYERLDQKKTAYNWIRSGTHKRTKTFYFFSGPSTKGAIRFNKGPGDKYMNFTFRDLKIESIDSLAEAGNLIPDSEFENEAVTTFWLDEKGNLLPFANAGFISGSRSLCFAVGASHNIQSAVLPFVPGKKYEFSFFAKATKHCPARACFSVWSPFGHAGNHMGFSFNAGITTEWKEYKFVYAFPADTEKYPDLAERMGTLILCMDKNVDGATVYFDKMSFREIK